MIGWLTPWRKTSTPWERYYIKTLLQNNPTNPNNNKTKQSPDNVTDNKRIRFITDPSTGLKDNKNRPEKGESKHSTSSEQSPWDP